MTPARILEKLRPSRAWFFPAGLFAVLLAAKLAVTGDTGATGLSILLVDALGRTRIASTHAG